MSVRIVNPDQPKIFQYIRETETDASYGVLGVFFSCLIMIGVPAAICAVALGALVSAVTPISDDFIEVTSSIAALIVFGVGYAICGVYPKFRWPDLKFPSRSHLDFYKTWQTLSVDDRNAILPLYQTVMERDQITPEENDMLTDYVTACNQRRTLEDRLSISGHLAMAREAIEQVREDNAAMRKQLER